MNEGKDSIFVINFMTLFSQIKDLCDSAPEHIPELADRDENFRGMCLDLQRSAWPLNRAASGELARLVAPVDPKFIIAWRDYEENYYSILDRYFNNFFSRPIFNDSTIELDKWKKFWDHADFNGEMVGYHLESVFEFAEYKIATHDGPLDGNGDLRDGEFAFRQAKAYWILLIDALELDLAGVFRREMLIPSILVPRHVAARHGDVQKSWLYQRLREVHKAFLFGAPVAAIALMRSIMEAVVKIHYGGRHGDDLETQINSITRKLPLRANAAALHGLRKAANSILHMNPDRIDGLPIDPRTIEKEIVFYLVVLKNLIEGAPEIK